MKPAVSLRRRAEQPIPTARQAIVRMIPSSAVLMFGIPGAALALPADAAQDDRMPWALLITTAALLLAVIVHLVFRAPRRPRQGIVVDRAQRRRALAAASQTGEVPTDPAVRDHWRRCVPERRRVRDDGRRPGGNTGWGGAPAGT